MVGANLNRRVKDCKGSSGFTYSEPLVYALLVCYILNKNYIKAIGFMVFRSFSPLQRKLMTDPQGMAKLDPKGTVGTIYAGG